MAQAAFSQRIDVVHVSRTKQWGVRIPETAQPPGAALVRVWLPFSGCADLPDHAVTVYATHAVPPPPRALVVGRVKAARATVAVWQPLQWCKHVLYVGLQAAGVESLQRALGDAGRVAAASRSLSGVLDALIQPAVQYRARCKCTLFARVELNPPHSAATLIYRLAALCAAVTWITCAHSATTPRPRAKAVTIAPARLGEPPRTNVAEKLALARRSLLPSCAGQHTAWPLQNTVYDGVYRARPEQLSWLALAAATSVAAPHLTPAFEPLRACSEAWHAFLWARTLRFAVMPHYNLKGCESAAAPAAIHIQHALALYYWGVLHRDDDTLPLPRHVLLRALEAYLVLGLFVATQSVNLGFDL